MQRRTSARFTIRKTAWKPLERSFVVKSLKTGGSLRFSLLGSVRQFASEQLSSEESRAVAERHFIYFLELDSKVDQNDFRTMLPFQFEARNLATAIELLPDQVREVATVAVRLFGAVFLAKRRK